MTTRNLRDVLAELPPEERAIIDDKAARIIAEEMTLRQIREARATSQAALAERLGVQQAAISKLERRADMYVSSLREHVAALGGTLVLQVEFPDREPVRIGQFHALRGGPSED